MPCPGLCRPARMHMATSGQIGVLRQSCWHMTVGKKEAKQADTDGLQGSNSLCAVLL